MIIETGFAESPLNYHIPLWMIVVYYFVAAAVGSLPAPKESSSDFYRWFFGFANAIAANLSRMQLAGRGNGNGQTKQEGK